MLESSGAAQEKECIEAQSNVKMKTEAIIVVMK